MVKIDVRICICCRYRFFSSTNCVMFSFYTNHNSVDDSINITTYVYIENERFHVGFSSGVQSCAVNSLQGGHLCDRHQVSVLE